MAGQGQLGTGSPCGPVVLLNSPGIFPLSRLADGCSSSGTEWHRAGVPSSLVLIFDISCLSVCLLSSLPPSHLPFPLAFFLSFTSDLQSHFPCHVQESAFGWVTGTGACEGGRQPPQLEHSGGCRSLSRARGFPTPAPRQGRTAGQVRQVLSEWVGGVHVYGSGIQQHRSAFPVLLGSILVRF